MRPTLHLAALAAAAILAFAPPLRAEGDVGRDARLLYVEGKFREADELLAKAGPEVANDVTLRSQLADAAQMFLKNRTGEERRDGLEAIKRNWGAVAAAHPEDGAAVCGAVLAAKGLADLDLAAKHPDEARKQATWALELGEKAAAAGLGADAKAALGEAYALRASTTRKVEHVDQVCGDFRKGAEMLEQAAAGHEKESVFLASAAEMRWKEAAFVHEMIPLDTEKRDDEAITAAAKLARRACEAKGAASEAFMLHIRTLCAAHDWNVVGDFGAPIMMPLAPPVEGLTLAVPKGVGWKRKAGDGNSATTDWELALERNYDPANDSGVQLMVMGRRKRDAAGAKTWADVDEAVATLFEKRKASYSDVTASVGPTLLGGKKKGPQMWVFEIAGTDSGSKRLNKMLEWIWVSTTRKDTVWDLKVVDWRRTVSPEDPDIVAFVQSAIPPGLWPAGKETPAEDPKRKPPPKKKQ